MKFGQFMSYSKRTNFIKKFYKNCGLKRTQKRLAKTDLNLNIESQSTKVNTTCSYNYLGVKVDPSLNLNEHFQSGYQTASSRLRLLRRIRSYLTKLAALRIYEAFVLSKIMYCSLTNYFHQLYRRDLLSSLERRAKVIVNIDGEFLSVEKKQKRKVCKLVRNCFDTIQHEKQTRNNYILRFPKIKLESTKKSFIFTVWLFMTNYRRKLHRGVILNFLIQN